MQKADIGLIGLAVIKKAYDSNPALSNLLQAQRDYFGAHTYERIDKPAGEYFHTNWTGSGGDTVSTSYNV